MPFSTEGGNARFLGMAKTHWFGLIALFAAITMALSAYSSIVTAKTQNGDIERNGKAVAFICSTTGVLESIVSGVYQRTAANITSGYYQNLVTRGLLTQTQYDQILIQQNEFAAGLKTLRTNTSCSTFKTKP